MVSLRWSCASPTTEQKSALIEVGLALEGLQSLISLNFMATATIISAKTFTDHFHASY